MCVCLLVCFCLGVVCFLDFFFLFSFFFFFFFFGQEKGHHGNGSDAGDILRQTRVFDRNELVAYAGILTCAGVKLVASRASVCVVRALSGNRSRRLSPTWQLLLVEPGCACTGC